MGAGRSQSEEVVTYCLVPPDLADSLHEVLREHFRERDVEVVVELRNGDRRQEARRNGPAPGAPLEERRRLRAEEGRRVADRRAALAPVDPMELPRRARRHVSRLSFVQRLAPTRRQAREAEDARLVARIQAGDTAAFSELYLCNFEQVYTYVRVALRDHHEAEDLTQQVFIKVLKALPRYERRAGTPFRAWLFRIARNEIISHLRRHGTLDVEDPEMISRRTEAQSPPSRANGGLGWISDADLVMFVERLPEAQRQTIVLRYMLDLTTEEMGQILGRNNAAVRQLEHRALKFLQQRLAAAQAGRAVRRVPMWTRMRPAPVMARRRFALGGPPVSGVRR